MESRSWLRLGRIFLLGEHATRPRTPAYCPSSSEIIHEHIGKPAKDEVGLVTWTIGIAHTILRPGGRLGRGGSRPTIQMLFNIAFFGVGIVGLATGESPRSAGKVCECYAVGKRVAGII